MCVLGDDNHPFHLQDISVVTPNGTFNAATATEAQLQTAMAANLLFATQKNGERGETVTQGDASSVLLSRCVPCFTAFATSALSTLRLTH